MPNLGVGFQLVPSDGYRTDYTDSYSHHHASRPPVLDFIEDTGDKVRSTIQNVGDKTRWFFKNKVQTKLNAVKNILPEIPSGYSTSSGYSSPSASYGVPVRSYENVEIDAPHFSESFPASKNNLQNGFIPTATVKSTYNSDVVSKKIMLITFNKNDVTNSINKMAIILIE